MPFTVPHHRSIVSAADPIIRTGLVGRWPLQEASGSTVALDDSGNGNDATLENLDPNTCWVAGPGGAAWLNGAMETSASTHRANFGMPAVLQITGPITYMIWAYLTTSISNVGAFTMNYADRRGWGLYTTNRGVIGDGTNAYYSGLRVDPGEFPLNTWIHLCVRFTGDQGFYYISAVQKESHTKTTTITYPGVTAGYIGNEQQGNRSQFGRYADARVYNRAIDMAELIQIVNKAG